MESFRQWLAGAIASILDFFARIFGQLARGIQYDWDTRIFVLGAGLFLIIGLAFMWRRKF